MITDNLTDCAAVVKAQVLNPGRDVFSATEVFSFKTV